VTRFKAWLKTNEPVKTEKATDAVSSPRKEEVNAQVKEILVLVASFAPKLEKYSTYCAQSPAAMDRFSELLEDRDIKEMIQVPPFSSHHFRFPYHLLHLLFRRSPPTSAKRRAKVVLI